MHRIPFPIIAALALIIVVAAVGVILSLVGALTSLVWRFVFSPLGVIAIIVLVICLIYGSRKR